MRDNRKTRYHAMLKVLAPIVLALAAIMSSFYNQSSSLERTRELVYRTLRDSAAEQSATLNTRLDGQFHVLETFASILAGVETSDSERSRLRMASVCESSDFYAMLLSDENGNGLSDGGETLSISDRRYFNESMAGRRAIERIEVGKLSREPVFMLSVPIRMDGRVKGVVAGSFNEEDFDSAVVSEAYSGKGFSFICDGAGNVIVGDKRSPYLNSGTNLFDIIEAEDIQYNGGGGTLREDLAAGTAGLASYVVKGQERYAAYIPLGIDNWVLFNVVPGAVVDAELAELSRGGFISISLMAGVSLIMIILIFILNRRYTLSLEREREALRASEERFSIALRAGDVRICEYDPRTRLLSGAEDGEARTLDEVAAAEGIHHDDAPAYKELFAKLDAGEPSVEGIFRVDVEDGESRYIQIRFTNLLDEQSKPYRAVGVYEDVTEKHNEQLRYEQELSYQRVGGADAYSTALVDLTARELRRFTCEALEDKMPLKMLTMDNFFQLNAAAVVSDEEVRRFMSSLSPEILEERFEKGQTSLSFEYVRRMAAYGDERWVRDEINLLREPGTGHLMAFIFVKDIDADRRRLENLEHAAETDAMTGFYNHNATLAHIENYLALDGSDGIHALYMMDIDNFKQVNDTFGHLVGDECIKQVAASLKKLFRTSDIMGRVGGDEFLVLMKNLSSAAHARRKAHEVVDSLQFAYTSAGSSMQVSVSLGVNIVRSGDGRLSDLVARTDAALYRAKKSGKNRYALAEGSTIAEGDEPPQKDIAASRAGLIQLQALLEYMDSGVVLLELTDEVRQIYVSPGFCRMMGVTAEEYSLPRVLRDVIIHPEDIEGYESALRAGAEWGAVVDHALRASADGERWHWQHCRAVRIPYEASEYPVLIAVLSDIDKLKEQEAALDFSEQRFRTALAKTGATVWEMDLRSGELFRTAGGQFLGREQHRFEGTAETLAVSGLLHPESEPEFRRMVGDILSGDDSGVYKLVTKDERGEYVPGTGKFALLRDAQGKPYYAIGILERRQDAQP